jgi:hypothetical protein
MTIIVVNYQATPEDDRKQKGLLGHTHLFAHVVGETLP